VYPIDSVLLGDIIEVRWSPLASTKEAEVTMAGFHAPAMSELTASYARPKIKETIEIQIIIYKGETK